MPKNIIQAIKMKENITNRGVTFVRSAIEQEKVPYNVLYKKALVILKRLKDMGVEAHDKLIFQLEDNEEFIITFWACILGRIIPVPLPIDASKEGVERLFRIFNKLDRPLIAMNKEIYTTLAKEEEHLLADRYIIINRNEVAESSVDLERTIEDEIDDDEVVLIQFSSGSTGEPKGVLTTNGNLVALITGTNEKVHVCEDDSTINWMPLSHNTGLVAGHLFSNFYNIDCHLIETKLFLMQPSIWFEKISELRGTFSCCPNFGYKHCMQMLKNKQLENVDLSCLKIVLNGAEPISKEVCELFVKMFGVYGLDKNVIVPIYGLSESTVGVAMADLYKPIESFKIDINGQAIGEKIKYLSGDQVTDGSIEVVSVGTSIKDTKIRIVDGQGIDLGEDRAGYIQIYGKTVTKGYYAMENAESGLFDDEGWLNTGDIGFIHEGKLVISGRDKDVIFVNGRNYYCNDIENMLIHEGVLAECVAVALYNEEKACDQIALFIKTSDESKRLEEIADKIKRIVFKHTNLKVDYVIPVEQIPRGKSGKVQRYKLQEAYKSGLFKVQEKSGQENLANKQAHMSSDADRQKLINQIQDIMQELIGFKIEDLNKSLLEYGIDSIKVPQFKKILEEKLNIEVPVSIVFDHPTINQMIDYLLEENGKEGCTQESVQNRGEEHSRNQDIVIIGVGCRFPAGANDITLFWEKLVNGQDFITDVPWERKELLSYSNESPENKVQGGFLEDVMLFDPSFFNITPLEAKYMDPQQRILLEVTHEALQSAGINDAKGSNTGVFIGISSNDYAEICKDELKKEINNYMITGNMLNIAAGRVGYVFDLHGPIVAIDTACSSSLVAVHEAAKSLKFRECDMALAGGVNLILSPKGYVGLRKMNALSPTNKCSTFDERADGYVRSEGCGVIVLKRYEDAIRDHDNIWAVIKGSAVNHDGRSSGLTAPNGIAQQQVIKKAINAANIAYEDIDYIETHGTGTKLGDPQEMNALANVFSHISNKKILLGSVKSNIGHTESAAGIASLIKVILSLKNKMIPGNLHFDTPNKYINWGKMPFEVVDKNYKWNQDKALTVGISSFGLSGTNVHMILKEFREAESNERKQAAHILTLSSKKEEALMKEIDNYIRYLEDSKESLSDICATSNKLKTGEKYKAAWICKDKASLIRQMQKYAVNKAHKKELINNKITFMFDGETSIYENMGKELYETNAMFRDILEAVNPFYEEVVGKSLEQLMYGMDIQKSPKKEIYSMIVVFEYALVQLWKKYGVIPDQVLGYGVGEYVAAYTTGIITIKEALQLAYEKGKIIDNMPGGYESILIFEGEEIIQSLIKRNRLKNVYITSINSDKRIVVVGCNDSIDDLKHILEENSYLYIVPENSSQPNRERLMDEEEIFSNMTRYINYKLPDKKFISLENNYKEAVNTPMYWTHSLCRITNFYKTISSLKDSGIFIEIGGATTLSFIVTELLDDNVLIMPTIRKVKGEYQQILDVICDLYRNGKSIDWRAVNANYVTTVAQLPRSVYMKKRYWFN